METNETHLGNGFILKRKWTIIKRKGRRTLYGWETYLYFDLKLINNEAAKNKI
jgi:hypothetical protein